MNQRDPTDKLFKLIQEEYQNGANEQDVAAKLVKCGLEPDKALSAAKAVRNSGNYFRKRAAAYLIGVALIVGVVVSLLVYLTGADSLVGNIQYLVLAFVISSALFVIFSQFSGKLVTYSLFVVCLMWVLSTAIYSIALYMHPGWDFVKDYRPGGLTLLLAGLLDFIGPKVLGVIMSSLSLCALFISWSFFHKIRTGNYDAIDT